MPNRSRHAVLRRAGGHVGEALHLSEEGEDITDLHLAVEAALLREVPHLIEGIHGARLPADPNAPGIRHDDAHDHPDRGGLPGSVRAEQPEHGALLDGEGEVLDGFRGAEGLADPVQAQYFHITS